MLTNARRREHRLDLRPLNVADVETLIAAALAVVVETIAEEMNERFATEREHSSTNAS